MGQGNLIERQTFGRPVVARAIQFESSRVQVGRRPLLWLNVVCLDAPLVAIAWQWLFARAFSVAVSADYRAALFLTAWFIYLVDRFADSISLRSNLPKSIRQRACFDHRKLWLALIVVVGILDAAIVFARLDHATAMRGLAIGAVAVGYLAVNWAFHRAWQTIPVKELIIGFVFASGTVLVSLPLNTIARSTIAFAIAAVLFAILCSLNCVSIAVWERNLDLLQAKHSIATGSLDVKDYAWACLIAIASISIILSCFGALDRTLAICLALSSVLLLLLHFVRIPRDERTALADLVLLTPFVLSLFEMVL